MSDPPLSSVGLDQYQSGYLAAAMLDKMMKNKPPRITGDHGQNR